MCGGNNMIPRKRPLLALLFAQAFLLAVFIFAMPASAGHHDESSSHEKDIVDVAVASGDFDTLVAALQAADLVETLKSDGPFTVFAPTDEAFAKLPAGTIEALLKPEKKDQLIAILTYHVIPGQVTAAEVVKFDSADTLNGKSVAINVDADTVRVNQATVVVADIAASNGVIHVIDEVILPPNS
jgi:uncharacterized surface protein with fasciclin (FAS1) repeats